MHQSHIIISLFIVLITFRLSLSAPTDACAHNYCQNTPDGSPPPNCVPAPISPIGKSQRHRRSVKDIRANTDGNFIHPFTRGNPLCFYPEGRLTKFLYHAVPSNVFYLPAGVYALKWTTGIIYGSTASAAIYFEIFEVQPDGIREFLCEIDKYGGTFFSDGTRGLVIRLLQPGHAGQYQTAEVWLQAVTYV